MFSNDRNPIMRSLDGSELSLAPSRNSLSPVSILATIGAERSNNLELRNATALAVHENYRALLTKVALDNVAALSALEAQLSNMAPLGQERYKTILDAHTMSTIMRLARW